MKAIMDIGTNSTRLLIGEYDSKKRRTKIYDRSLVSTRIGEELVSTNMLSQKGQLRTLQALREFNKIINSYSVEEIIIVATSAVRDAYNGIEFSKLVEENFGWKVRIITGEEEAYLSYIGATSGLKLKENNNYLVLDIGGGSTEISFSVNGKVIACSAPIGAVRLKEKTLEKGEISSLIKDSWSLSEVPKGKLLAVGGTATTLAAIAQGMVDYNPEEIQGFCLSDEQIYSIYKILSLSNLEERKKVPGLLPERADIIIYGIQILLIVMQILNANEVVISDYDLLHGLLL